MPSRSIVRIPGGVKASVALFLVEHGGVLSIVDTGITARADRILRALRAHGRRIEDVRQIALTHCHGDHTGSARRLKEATGAVVVAGKADAPVIEGAAPYPGPVDRLMATIYRDLERFPRFPVDRAVSGREELDGGLVAIPTPGHTDGHIAVALPELSTVFVGDLVWNIGTLRPSWRRLTQDPARNAESIRELAGMGFTRIVPGHGREVSGQRLSDLAARLKR